MMTAKADLEELQSDGSRPEQSSDERGAAFAALVALYGDDVYGVARNMCATLAEANEITVNTFVSAYEGIAPWPSDASPRSWLCGTAARIALARLSGRGKAGSPQRFGAGFEWPADLLRTGGHWPDSSDAAQESVDLAGLLHGALQTLDERVRAAFVLSDLALVSVGETARILQTSRYQINAQVHRARLFLRQVLDSFFQDKKARS
jgi:RNA polymerase sigma factor (sigma-70 family)